MSDKYIYKKGVIQRMKDLNLQGKKRIFTVFVFVVLALDRVNNPIFCPSGIGMIKEKRRNNLLI